ncbi:MAG: AAA family ATPase, partial [Parachlamydiaceae bacterium]
MEPCILNTPQDIYEATIVHFPSARVKVERQKTGLIAVKIFLNSKLPEIQLNGPVYKKIFQLRLQEIKVLRVMDSPMPSSLWDSNYCLMEQSFTKWERFNRKAYESQSGYCADLIASYLNHPTQETENELFLLELTAAQVCCDKQQVSDKDLVHFRSVLDKDLGLKAKMQLKYPGNLEQIIDRAIEEDHKYVPQSYYHKTLETLQARVLGQEMAVSAVASALASQNSGNHQNHTFLFVGPTGTGKTELAKTIATIKKSFISFKMNQYPNPHDSTRFFGSPTGYSGSDSKSDLGQKLDSCDPTESGFSEGKKIFTVKNVVVLFDELEKAHATTRQSLLTLFDEGTVDISYTEPGFLRGNNVTIEYQLESSVIIATSNLFQEHICRAFQENKDAEKIAEIFTKLNMTHSSPEKYSPEFLGRVTIVPFGPIPKGTTYQNILKMKVTPFLKELKTEIGCHSIEIQEEGKHAFYQTLENILYGNGSNIRKVQKFLGKIKRVIHQNRHQYGDISNKKFTLYCDNGKI